MNSAEGPPNPTCMIQGCYFSPDMWTLWLLWSCCAGGSSPTPHAVLVILSPPHGPCGSGGPVHVVLLLPLWTLWLLWSCCAACERQPVRYCPLYGTDSKAVRCHFSTFKHAGAGSPYIRNLSTGHHALVVGHVTARQCRNLKASPCGTYAVLVIFPPFLWSCGSGDPVHVVLMVY